MKDDSKKNKNTEPNREIDAKELANVTGGYESQADQEYRTWWEQNVGNKKS